MDKGQLRIAHVETDEHIGIVRNLLLEYWSSFGFDPAFQAFSDEIAGLPGKYARPDGRLALAMVKRAKVADAGRQTTKEIARPLGGRLETATVLREVFGDEAVGCIALRRVDARRCEAKRLYVRNEFRGRGIARELLKWLIAEARAAGYSELVGDTMPSMSQALAMYERLGFRRVPPYALAPTPGAIYLSLNLES